MSPEAWAQRLTSKRGKTPALLRASWMTSIPSGCTMPNLLQWTMNWREKRVTFVQSAQDSQHLLVAMTVDHLTMMILLQFSNLLISMQIYWKISRTRSAWRSWTCG
jgi:hypothetical protein